MTLIMAVLFGSIGLLLIPETSAAKILQTRAKNLRHETKNWALHSKADETRINAKSLLTVYLLRPFVMLVQEPILALVTAYMSFIYGILYLLFEAVRSLWNFLSRENPYLRDSSIPLRSTRNAAGTWESAPFRSLPSSWALRWAPP